MVFGLRPYASENYVLKSCKSQSHVNRFGYIQLTILVIIFALELAQMNTNKWGDSWGAGCIVAAVGYALRKFIPFQVVFL